jgi:hypothetical protein
MDTEIYRERVLPSAATFSLAPMFAVFIYGVWLPLNEVVGVVSGVLAGTALALIFWLKAPVIEVSKEFLSVGRARIPRAHLGAVEIVPAEDSFAARGHQLDSRAFTSFQASVRTMLRVNVDDASDPTPYLLFSTRKPEAVKAALS